MTKHGSTALLDWVSDGSSASMTYGSRYAILRTRACSSETGSASSCKRNSCMVKHAKATAGGESNGEETGAHFFHWVLRTLIDSRCFVALRAGPPCESSCDSGKVRSDLGRFDANCDKRPPAASGATPPIDVRRKRRATGRSAGRSGHGASWKLRVSASLSGMAGHCAAAGAWREGPSRLRLPPT